jgi:four helix bundle protein
MFLRLNHKSLTVYQDIRNLIKEVYFITQLLPEAERFNLITQIRRASVSIKLNLAEGSTRRSEIDRRRYYEISRGSLVEVECALEIAVDLNFLKMEDLTVVGELIKTCFIKLSGMINCIPGK